jgi:hypothetical protein
VCDHYWDRNVGAKCVAGGHDTKPEQLLQDCTPAQVVVKYPTKLYPKNHCGTFDPQRNLLDCATPPGWVGGPGPVEPQQSWICKGNTWDPGLTLALADRFSLDLVLTTGPMTFDRGETRRLGESRVEIPAALLKAAGPELRVEKDDIVFALTVTSSAPDRIALPDQGFEPVSIDENVRVISASVAGGAATWKLAVLRPALGAFRTYAINLQGLQLRALAAPPYAAGPAPTVGAGPSPVDPNAVALLAELSSGERPLSSGALTVGAVSAKPRDVKVILTIGIVIAVLLLISMAMFWRRRRAAA